MNKVGTLSTVSTCQTSQLPHRSQMWIVIRAVSRYLLKSKRYLLASKYSWCTTSRRKSRQSIYETFRRWFQSTSSSGAIKGNETRYSKLSTRMRTWLMKCALPLPTSLPSLESCLASAAVQETTNALATFTDRLDHNHNCFCTSSTTCSISAAYRKKSTRRS